MGRLVICLNSRNLEVFKATYLVRLVSDHPQNAHSGNHTERNVKSSISLQILMVSGRIILYTCGNPCGIPQSLYLPCKVAIAKLPQNVPFTIQYGHHETTAKLQQNSLQTSQNPNKTPGKLQQNPTMLTCLLVGTVADPVFFNEGHKPIASQTT